MIVTLNRYVQHGMLLKRTYYVGVLAKCLVVGQRLSFLFPLSCNGRSLDIHQKSPHALTYQEVPPITLIHHTSPPSQTIAPVVVQVVIPPTYHTPQPLLTPLITKLSPRPTPQVIANTAEKKIIITITRNAPLSADKALKGWSLANISMVVCLHVCRVGQSWSGELSGLSVPIFPLHLHNCRVSQTQTHANTDTNTNKHEHKSAATELSGLSAQLA